MIAVAYGPSNALRLVGLIAVSDPPREDLAKLIGTLQELGVRTVMVTGDSPVTGGGDRAEGRHRRRCLFTRPTVERAER